ncbi:gluconokinase [Mucilaginibacter sp. McL0603]|uniref:gluconokinase n=1 Tax=Mucilaginibacter sp. McL0603 TaxID=3415670 RepID=UPI003CF8A931
MKYVLGIDIGTGSVKAVAVDLDGKSFEVSQQHYPFSAPKPGYHEQDPELIWSAFSISIKGIIDKTGAQPSAISLSSAMHSFIVVDENCKPLAPMITWADSRSSEIAAKLRNTERGIAIYTATGTPIHAMSPLCKLIWLKENNGELFRKAHKFISIKEFIWYKLFKEFTIDHSIASSTSLFDIVELKWYDDALRLAGISASLLSKPVTTDYYKEYKDPSSLNFLKTGIPIIIGASDGCLANLGSMANKPGIAAITIGTSGAIRVASNKPLPNPSAMTFSYILDKETFICGGPINNGGVAMQWWLKNISGPDPKNDDYNKLFEQIALVSAGSNGLIFLPYLTGERAPIWDGESCGNFFGVKLQHKQPDFSRAVMEGICYALKDVLDAVQQNSKLITQINVSGGFTKSDVWVQTLADITGKNLAILQADDASAVGAAFMALKNIGVIKEYPSVTADLKVFKPQTQNTEVYSRNFTIYRQLYSDLKETMHKVYKMNN